MVQKSNDTLIARWLFFTAFMVFAMAVIGAVTRLTESGLSMVEWRPLIGAIPPLTDAEWDRVFGLYQQTPEFQKKNFWMGLEDFKRIFFWEWFHRVWGRLIGLVYALPLCYFWVRGMIPQGYKPKLLGLLVLGGLQGALGWYMVVSGLVDRPSVSHFRLAAHLSLAILVFAALIWIGLDLVRKDKQSACFCLLRHGWITLAFVAITIVWGAFVAGLDGGLLYNSWPMMGPHWVPPEVTGLSSLLLDPAAVQFFHRWIAIVTAVVVLSFAWRIRSFWLAAAITAQVGLGIATVLSQVAIPLAALHQAGALVLVALLVNELNKRRLQ